MDVVVQRRLAAHRKAAIVYGRNAEFHHALSQTLEMTGDNAHATWARELAEHHRERALREWDYAEVSPN